MSGGQKKKLALACVLLSKNEILILDEPTNHLDHVMTQWLENWLKGYKGALIMITHDRYFLDRICNKIVELDKTKLYSYKTDYEGFLELKAQREEMQLSTQEKHRSILRKEIAWMQRGARARSTKQKAHIQRYEALRDEEKVQIDESAEIDSLSTRLGNKTIELHNISISFDNRVIIKERKKYMNLALVALGLSLTFAPLVRAEEAQTETVNGYSKEVWDKLMDNTLEYNEIDDLVHNFNPDIALARKKFNSNVDSISNNIDELEVALRDRKSVV